MAREQERMLDDLLDRSNNGILDSNVYDQLYGKINDPEAKTPRSQSE
jgi:hypothetical protein